MNNEEVGIVFATILMFSIAFGIVTSCKKQDTYTHSPKAEVSLLNMRCEKVGGYVVRCENSEATCYTRTDSLQCKFKDIK